MNKYICDKCGQIIFSVEDNVILSTKCLICQGMLISEAEIQRREEIQKNVEEDIADDDITPKQDAYEIDDILKHDLVEQMKENIKREGNDRVWMLIENNIWKADQRARMRMFFTLAGGTCPEGQAINV